MNNVMSSPTGTSYRIAQYDTFRNPAKVLELQKNLLTAKLNGIGLDPYFGFMHKTHNSFQALVYDLIEPFRWLVENAVYKVVVEESNHGRSIKKNEYAWTREGKIILDSGLIQRFLELLERLFQSERLC